MDFTMKLALGILGILLYTVWMFRDHLRTPSILRTKQFWNEYFEQSKFSWLWSVLMLALVIAIVSISPETAQAIADLTGLQVVDNAAAFFTFGLGISALTDSKPQVKK